MYSEIFKKYSEIFKTHTEQLTRHTDILNNHTEKIRLLEKENNDLKQRISHLEQKELKNTNKI